MAVDTARRRRTGAAVRMKGVGGSGFAGRSLAITTRRSRNGGGAPRCFTAPSRSEEVLCAYRAGEWCAAPYRGQSNPAPRNMRLIPTNIPSTQIADSGHDDQINAPRITSMIPLNRGQPHAAKRWLKAAMILTMPPTNNKHARSSVRASKEATGARTNSMPMTIDRFRRANEGNSRSSRDTKRRRSPRLRRQSTVVRL